MLLDSALGFRFYAFEAGVKPSVVLLLPLLVMVFLVLRSQQISLWYMGLFGAILGAVSYFYENLWGGFLACFLSVALLLALIDQKYLCVPTWLNLLSVVVGFFGLFFSEDLLLDFASGFALAGILAFMQIMGRVILGREILGDGDVVFVIGVGFVFGLLGGFSALFWGSVAGVCNAIFKRKKGEMPLISLIVAGLFLDFGGQLFLDFIGF